MPSSQILNYVKSSSSLWDMRFKKLSTKNSRKLESWHFYCSRLYNISTDSIKSRKVSTNTSRTGPAGRLSRRTVTPHSHRNGWCSVNIGRKRVDVTRLGLQEVASGPVRRPPGHPDWIWTKQGQLAGGGDKLGHLFLLGQWTEPGEGGLVPGCDVASHPDLQGGVEALEALLLYVLHQGAIPNLLPQPGPFAE